jgi:hypothetical protein
VGENPEKDVIGDEREGRDVGHCNRDIIVSWGYIKSKVRESIQASD